MTMDQNESQWDKLLKIKTTGRDDSHSNQYRYPNEPTPYAVLERLASSGYIGKKNTLLDYGTGKGRVCFYLSYLTRCKSIGIECDEGIYAGATPQTGRPQFREREPASSGKKQTSMQSRERWIDSTSLTHFP